MILHLRAVSRLLGSSALLALVLAGSAVAFAGPAVDAARKGDVKKLKALIDQDAKAAVSDRDGNGDTPLHQAALHGQVAAVQLLLDAGADVNAKNNYGPYMPGNYWGIVSSKNQEDPVKILNVGGNDTRYLKNGYTPLHLAIFSTNHKKIVDLLVSKGANVNDQPSSGATPLMFAVMRGQKDDMTYLLEHGANPNLADAYGETPLDCALQRGYQSLVQPLVDKGADVNAVAQDTKRPLTYAMSNPSLDSSIVNFLKKHGAHE